MLLMTLVDNRAGSLEASPYLFSEVLGNGTCLTKLLVQLLQLMESADYVRLISQLLSGLAELCFLL